MKEIKTIIDTFDSLSAEADAMALATVVHVENSSYRRSGARMLIASDGTWTGGISGGCLEGDTLRKAKQAMLSGESVTVRYDTRDGDPNQIGVGLGCNGLIDVLITPLSTTKFISSPIEVLKRCVAERKPHVLITVLESHESSLVGNCIYASDGEINLATGIHRSVAEELKYMVGQVKVVKKSRSAVVQGEQGCWKFFIEYLPPPVALYICGNNYDAKPLAVVAHYIGWQVHLVANPLKIRKELFELAASVIHPEHDLPPLDYHSAVVLMAHDLQRDTANLRKVMQSEAGYIGVLGPKKRGTQMLDALLVDSPTTALPKQVYTPVGLDTGATTPEEIAVSIIAEIRAHYSHREGGHLRDRPLPIHE